MKEDFNRLRLKHHGDPTMMHNILQLECRSKTASKLPETLRCENFSFPSLAVAEMATSDAIARLHTDLIAAGSNVLDMTFGLGIDAFHFASKAAHVTALEYNHDTYMTGKANIQALGIQNLSLIEGDSISWLKDNNRCFDIIFIDPARRDNAGRHFALKDCLPDIIPIMPLLLSRSRRLIVKASPMLDIKKTIEESGISCDIMTIGTVKECKELVLVIDNHEGYAENQPSRLSTSCLTVGQEPFRFTPEEELQAVPAYALPEKGGFLLEPYPAVMKGGGMKLLSARYDVDRLHPNTNLFTTRSLPTSFPGEYFSILEVLPFDKKTVKRFSANYPHINVAVRNFPLSAPQLAAKLKIREGGNCMAFGTTGPDGQKLLVITSMGLPCGQKN